MSTTDRTFNEIKRQVQRSDLPSTDQLRGWSAYFGLAFPEKDFKNRPKTTEKIVAWAAIKFEVAKRDLEAILYPTASTVVEPEPDPTAVAEVDGRTDSIAVASNTDLLSAAPELAKLGGLLAVPVVPESPAASGLRTASGSLFGGRVKRGQAEAGHSIRPEEPDPAVAQPVETATVSREGLTWVHPGSGAEKIWLVADLRPNEVNSKVFKQSLSKAGIAALADDIAENGLRYPLDIMPDGTVLDGDRRRLAITELGWTHVRVTVRSEVKTADDIEHFIVRAYSTTRDATVEERVNVYKLAKDVLAREHGRAAHRPEKGSRGENSFWEKERVWSEAAKLASFGSYQLADKAAKVFAVGDEAVKAVVNGGEMSVSSAYDKLSKGSSPKPKARASRGKQGQSEASSPSKTDGSADGATHGQPSIEAPAQAAESELVKADDPVPVLSAGGTEDNGAGQMGHGATPDVQTVVAADVAVGKGVATVAMVAALPIAATPAPAASAAPTLTVQASATRKVVVSLHQDQSAQDVIARIGQLCADTLTEAVCCITSQHMLLEPARAALAERGYRYSLSAHGHDDGAHRYMVIAWRPGCTGGAAFDFGTALGFVPAE
jgi:hypothetical protein